MRPICVNKRGCRVTTRREHYASVVKDKDMYSKLREEKNLKKDIYLHLQCMSDAL